MHTEPSSYSETQCFTEISSWPTEARDACISAPKPVGRRTRKPGIDRKPRQAYSAKQLERLEAEFKVNIHSS
jgi:hypothetical protein